jgi:hypothetical protein
VLLIRAGLDTVVPQRQHRLLWESLGRPRELCLAGVGHYGAGLLIDAVLDAVAGFYRERIAASAGA